MTDQWYYRQASAEFGPYSLAQLRQFVLAGRITAQTLVRPGKNADWVPASRVKSLWAHLEKTGAAHAPSGPPPLPPRQSGSATSIGAYHPQSSPPSILRARRRPALAIATSLVAVCLLAILLIGLVVARRNHAETSTSTPFAANVAAAEEPAAAAPGALPHAPAPGLTTEQIVARCESSVALLKGSVSAGTGFLIGPKLLVTNAHVLSEELMDRVEVYFPSGKGADHGPFKPTLILEDERRDLALVSVETGLKPLALTRNYQFRRGQEITVIGNPGVGDNLLQNAVSRGVMSTEITIGGQPYHQLGISINPGNSGGPVFDSDAQVIGVVTLKASGKEGLAFSIPVAEVRKLRDRVGTVTQNEIDLTQANHRARVCYRSIAMLGAAYKSGMQLYVSAMKTALDQQATADAGLSAVQDKVQSKLQAMNHALLGALRGEIPRVGSDPLLPEATRQKLLEFWSNYLEMKSYVDDPRGTYLTYQAKCDELADTHDRLGASLKALLGIEDEGE